MRLLPAVEAYAETIAAWPASGHEVTMWCGRREYPLPPRVVAEWLREQDVRAYALLDGRDLLGYGELWFDAEEDEVELARVIVAPGFRGRGVGRALVRNLTGLALDAGQANIFMRVHPDNQAALRCYRHAGFHPVDDDLAAAWNAAQPVAYVWLRHAAPADHPSPG
ncbi:GNAT family N-acetyltransferase [Thermopolyspora sp. NPDC052614]|uniref:GNAT family N-acetyltransferase n=1 Tax=Thermopolyspora sp. NPDC052614 TaxID=3155682 RepID=UPI00341753DD